MNTFTRRPEPEQTHFILGQGRLGLTLLNSFIKIGIPVVDVPEQADVIWFCLPETALKAEGKKMARRVSSSAAFVHTSGFLTSEVLRVRPEIEVASLHPAYSFSEGLRNMPEGILWTFEGDSGLRDLLFFLVSSWKGKWSEITPNEKIPYHIACVLMGNLIDVPVAAAETLCKKYKFPFSDMVASLLLPHAKGYKGGRIKEKTTGPAARGDTETVTNEAAWLRRNLPELEEIYSFLSEMIQKKK